MYNTKQLSLECCYAALNQSSVTAAKRLAQPSMTTSIFSDGRSSLLLLLLLA